MFKRKFFGYKKRDVDNKIIELKIKHENEVKQIKDKIDNLNNSIDDLNVEINEEIRRLNRDANAYNGFMKAVLKLIDIKSREK